MNILSILNKCYHSQPTSFFKKTNYWPVKYRRIHFKAALKIADETKSVCNIPR